jgi:methyl-accepting chemotaxis protein
MQRGSREVEVGTQRATNAGQSLKNIVSASGAITAMVQSISAAADELRSHTQRLREMIRQFDLTETRA